MITFIIQAAAVMTYVVAFGVDNAIVVSPMVRRLGRFKWVYMTVGPLVIVTLELAFPVLMVSIFHKEDFFVSVLGVVQHPRGFAERLGGLKIYTDVFAGVFLVLSGVFGMTEDMSDWVRRAARGTAASVLAVAVTEGAIEYGLGFAIMAVASAVMWGAIGGLQNTLRRKSHESTIMVILVVEAIEFAFSLDSLSGALTATSNPLVLVGGLLAGAALVRGLVLFSIRKGVDLSLRYLEFGAFSCISMLGSATISGIWVDIPDVPIEVAGLAMIGIAVFASIARRT